MACANADRVSCRHMASLCHNELIIRKHYAIWLPRCDVVIICIRRNSDSIHALLYAMCTIFRGSSIHCLSQLQYPVFIWINTRWIWSYIIIKIALQHWENIALRSKRLTLQIYIKKNWHKSLLNNIPATFLTTKHPTIQHFVSKCRINLRQVTKKVLYSMYVHKLAGTVNELSVGWDESL